MLSPPVHEFIPMWTDSAVYLPAPVQARTPSQAPVAMEMSSPLFTTKTEHALVPPMHAFSPMLIPTTSSFCGESCAMFSQALGEEQAPCPTSIECPTCIVIIALQANSPRHEPGHNLM